MFRLLTLRNTVPSERYSFNCVALHLSKTLFDSSQVLQLRCRFVRLKPQTPQLHIIFMEELSYVLTKGFFSHSFSPGPQHVSFSHRRYEIVMFSSNEIRLPSSFSVIHMSGNIKSSVQKDTTLLLFFLSKSPGGYAIFGLPYLLSSFILVCLWCGRTVGRSGGVQSPNFLGWVDLLSYGAPHSRA